MSPATYEVREDPDDMPFVFDTYADAIRFTRKPERNDRQWLIYKVTDEGETYIGAT